MAAGFLAVLLGRDIVVLRSSEAWRLPGSDLWIGTLAFTAAAVFQFIGMATRPPINRGWRQLVGRLAGDGVDLDGGEALEFPGSLDWDGQRHSPDRAKVEALADEPHLGVSQGRSRRALRRSLSLGPH